MDRRLLAGALGLLVMGCAQTRTPLPNGAPSVPPIEMGGYTPIRESINRTTDPATQRASVPNPTPVENGPPPIPDADSPPPSPGRPAPFAGKTEGTPRLQASPAGRPDDTPGSERPAPASDRKPPGPRPQAKAAGVVEPPATAPPMAPIPSATKDDSKVDTEVAQTSSASKPAPRLKVLPGASGTAATVGGEVITLTQLRAALKDQLDRIPPEQRSDPSMQRQVVDRVLSQLIERTLLVQAAKKTMKDPKALNQFFEAVDKAWTEHEMPPMLRETKTANIHELKAKMADQGASLDQIREDFRQNTLAREFMMMKLGSKLTISLNEKQAFYSAHVDDFKRPAQVSWREIAIDTAKCANRDEARRKIDAILARVSKGEDFAKVAKAESHGATARDGGLWEIAPGSYAIPAVNESIDVLDAGQISRVIEAPAGFHIVKVESKRAAGPARFDEVQDQIRELALRQKQAKLFGGFIDNLRAKTLITTMFDPPTSDPSAVRTGAQGSPPK